MTTSDSQPNAAALERAAAETPGGIVPTVAVGFAKGLLETIPGASIMTGIMDAVARRADQRAQVVIAMAVQAVRGDVAFLQQRLDDDDELAGLWARGLETARKTGLQTKLRVFAAILAGSVRATYQQRAAAGVVIRVLEDVDEEHIEIMHLCDTASRLPPPTLDDGTLGRSGATTASLSTALPHLDRLLPILIADLTALSLIENAWANTWAGLQADMTRYVPTALGHELLRVLRTAPTEPDEPSTEQDDQQ